MQLKRGPRNHGELVAWQLCAHLRRLVWDATREGPVKADRSYCDQIRSAARTACYMTSEGFYRTREGEFLNCLVMAHAALTEADAYVDHALEKRYIAPLAHGAMKEAAARALSANRRLRDSLRSQWMAQQDAKRKTCRRR